MEPAAEGLAMYGRSSDAAALEWVWVDGRLRAAGTYWVVVPTATVTDHPHPRPVWGVWTGDAVHLSVGSPRLAAGLGAGSTATIHLDDGTDVVIVDGVVSGPTTEGAVLAAYDAKYGWMYSVDEYGPLTTVAAAKVMAWRAAGWAGRDGFQAAGRWRFRTAGP
jgi:hypothetical protein